MEIEPKCDDCHVARATVFCKIEMAKRCLKCDGSVHSANQSFLRHIRSLICDKCQSEMAAICCLNERLSLCQDCRWAGNNCSDLGHRIHSLSPYWGCPSFVDFTKMWCMYWEPSDSASGFHHGRTNEGDNWIGSSATSPSSSSSRRFQNPRYPSSCLMDLGDIGEGLDLDDVQLVNFDTSEDILEPPQGQNNCFPVQDAPPARLFQDNNSWLTESYCSIDNTLEASSSVQKDCIMYQSSPAENSVAKFRQSANSSRDSRTPSSSSRRRIVFGLPEPRTVHSNISTSLSDYEDRSPSLPPPESNREARKLALMRFLGKKSRRKYGIQVRYAFRKARADSRKRVKGRFVKDGEAYDYDPVGDKE